MHYASIAVAVMAACVAGAAGQCPDGSAPTVIDNMSYCEAVQAVTYQKFSGAGSYNRITNMDSQTGVCESTTVGYSGPLTPLDEEVGVDDARWDRRCVHGSRIG